MQCDTFCQILQYVAAMCYSVLQYAAVSGSVLRGAVTWKRAGQGCQRHCLHRPYKRVHAHTQTNTHTHMHTDTDTDTDTNKDCRHRQGIIHRHTETDVHSLRHRNSNADTDINKAMQTQKSIKTHTHMKTHTHRQRLRYRHIDSYVDKAIQKDTTTASSAQATDH